ncbi:hypothetical protein ACFL6E_07295 [Candidatus Neomarinimicrobiota bacterium]
MISTRFLAITFMVTTLAYGQTGLELYGFGMPQPEGDAISSATGGITVLGSDANRHSFGATASWYKARGTQLSAVLGSQTTTLGDGEQLRRTRLYEVQFLAHLNTRSAWGMFIKPATRMNSFASFSDSIAYSTSDILHYDATGRARGGISIFAVGYSQKLSDKVSLGVSAQFLFGIIARSDTIAFTNLESRTDVISRLTAQQRTEFAGRIIALNMIYEGIPYTDGEIGLSLELPLAFDLHQVQKNPFLPKLAGVRHNKVGFPRTIKLGYGHPLKADQRLITEISWSNLPGDNKNDILFKQYIDHKWTIRGGWSRFRREREESIFGRYDYRVGFYYTKYYLSGLNKDDLGERSLSLGMGYLFNRSGQRLDIAFIAGDRSGLPQLESEKFYRITLGLSTAEVWFARPKKKWD